MSGDVEETADEIVVTALSQVRVSEHIYLAANDDGGSGDDFMSRIRQGIDNATRNTGVAYDQLMAAIADRIADDDGDGVMNFEDKMKGIDDDTPHITSDSGQRMAEVGELNGTKIYRLFDSDGNGSTRRFADVGSQIFVEPDLGPVDGFSNNGSSYSFREANDLVHYYVEFP